MCSVRFLRNRFFLVAVCYASLVMSASLMADNKIQAPDVRKQFTDMQSWGDPLAVRIEAVDGYSIEDLTDYTTAIGAGFPERHYQGIGRNQSADGTPYLYLTRSRNPNSLCFVTGLSFNPECFRFGAGELLVAEMGSRFKSGERLMSNRYERGKEFDKTLPPEADKYVRALRFDGRNGFPRAFHPSGFAVYDDVLLIGYASGCGDGAGGGSETVIPAGTNICPGLGNRETLTTGVRTQIDVCEEAKLRCTDPDGLLLVDVRNPKAPQVIRRFPAIYSGGGTTSVVPWTNAAGENVLLIGELIGTGSAIAFYQTNTTNLRDENLTLDSIGTYGFYDWLGCTTKDAVPDGNGAGTECSDGDRDDMYIGSKEYAWADDPQGFNLVREQESGDLFAFIFDNRTDSLSDGDDIGILLTVSDAVIQRVEENPAANDWSGLMGFAGSKHFEANDAGQGAFSTGIAPMGDFEAAVSLYTSPTGQLILYSAMHDGSSLDDKNIVEMGEFRNRYVMAPTLAFDGGPSDETIVCASNSACGTSGSYCVGSEAVYPRDDDWRLAQRFNVLTGDLCRQCEALSDCSITRKASQCGTVFNFGSAKNEHFGPGPAYPEVIVGLNETVFLHLPPYALVQPWVMLHDEYDPRTEFSSEDPAMSLMMDYDNRGDDDFGDLSRFDSPGNGTFDDDTSAITHCMTSGIDYVLMQDSGGGCKETLATSREGGPGPNSTGGASFYYLPSATDDEASCVLMPGEPNKSESIIWKIDGVVIEEAKDKKAHGIAAGSLGPGKHTVLVTLWDKTIGAVLIVERSNARPSFTAASPPPTLEDGGPVQIDNWATFNAGHEDEGEQSVLSYNVGSTSSLFSVAPSVSNDGTLTYTPAPNAYGTATISVAVKDDGGTDNGGIDTSESRQYTITVLPVNDAPVFIATPPEAVDEDSGPQVISHWAQFGAGPDNEQSQRVDAYLVSAVSTPDLFSEQPSVDNAGTLTFTPAANASGSSTFVVRVRDNGGTSNGGVNTSGTQEFSLTVNAVNDPPVVSSAVPATQSVQYSDGIASITIQASDRDSSGLTLTSDTTLPTGLSLSTASCSAIGAGTLFGDGAECRWTLSGDMGEGSGALSLAFTVTDGDLTDAAGAQITVQTEEAAATLQSTNPVTVVVASDGGSSGQFDLLVDVRELYDSGLLEEPKGGDSAAPGDIALADVSISLVPVGPGGTVAPSAACQLKDNGQNGYDKVVTATCPFTNVPVNVYSAMASISGRYYHQVGKSEDVLVINDPSLGFTTGGGWFYWPGTQEKTNFGYSMSYSQNGKKVGKPKGGLMLIRHLPDDQGIYRIKSNALTGLSLGKSGKGSEQFGWASFVGKNTFLQPGMDETEGNHSFTVYVEDHSGSDREDRIWIQVRGKDGETIPELSMPLKPVDEAVDMSGGGITVP